MTVFQAFVLGVIQGIAEFLPISSSAHLSLAPWLFGWPASGLGFDVALHVGTLVALLWYFRQQWRELAIAAIEIVRTRRIATVAQRRVRLLAIATVPAAIAGLLLEEYAETIFREPVITAIALIVLGILLWLVDRYLPHERTLESMGWRDALGIGLAQCLALVPGVSRSGATITAARALGIDRQGAAVFSFLMSAPIIAAAAIFKVPSAIEESGVTLPLVVGVVAAALSSWFAIAVMLRYVARHTFSVFAVYRVVLGCIVLWILGTQA